MRALLSALVLVAACSSNDAASPPTEDDDDAQASSSSSSGDAGTEVDAAAPLPTENDVRAASWHELDAAPSIEGKQDDVFLRGALGWSVNGLGEIWHTPDAGSTWEKLLSQPGTYFRAITFTDDQHGFVGNIGTGYYPDVTDETPLYATSDGGHSWSAVTTIDGPTPKGICNFSAVGDRTIVATGRVGGPAFVVRSDDAGATWRSQQLEATKLAMLVDSHFTDASTGVLTGASTTGADSHCRIVRTTDGGATWNETFTSKAAGEMCWKLSFPTPDVGYAAVLTFGQTKSSFLKTTDGGVTWSELPFTGGVYAALAVGFLTPDIGWIAGEAGKKGAYRTTDGGATWEKDASLGPYINRIRFTDARTGYAIGSSLYKLEIP